MNSQMNHRTSFKSSKKRKAVKPFLSEKEWIGVGLSIFLSFLISLALVFGIRYLGPLAWKYVLDVVNNSFFPIAQNSKVISLENIQDIKFLTSHEFYDDYFNKKPVLFRLNHCNSKNYSADEFVDSIKNDADFLNKCDSKAKDESRRLSLINYIVEIKRNTKVTVARSAEKYNILPDTKEKKSKILEIKIGDFLALESSLLAQKVYNYFDIDGEESIGHGIKSFLKSFVRYFESKNPRKRNSHKDSIIVRGHTDSNSYTYKRKEASPSISKDEQLSILDLGILSKAREGKQAIASAILHGGMDELLSEFDDDNILLTLARGDIRTMSTSPFHYHGDSINELLIGQKHWYLYPPNKYPTTGLPFRYFTMLDWLQNFYPQLVSRYFHIFLLSFAYPR